MLNLVTMSENVFQEYQCTAIKNYASELLGDGKCTAADALEQSRKEHQRLLPHGLRTEGNYFWSLVEQEQGSIVGMLWFASIERDGKRTANVYDFMITPEWRCRGYGAEAFQLMEEKVNSLDLSSIALYVFGHKHAAYTLFQKLGHVISHVGANRGMAGSSSCLLP